MFDVLKAEGGFNTMSRVSLACPWLILELPAPVPQLRFCKSNASSKTDCSEFNGGHKDIAATQNRRATVFCVKAPRTKQTRR